MVHVVFHWFVIQSLSEWKESEIPKGSFFLEEFPSDDWERDTRRIFLFFLFDRSSNISSSEVQVEDDEFEEYSVELVVVSVFFFFFKKVLIFIIANLEQALIMSLVAPGCSCWRYGSEICLILENEWRIKFFYDYLY